MKSSSLMLLPAFLLMSCGYMLFVADSLNSLMPRTAPVLGSVLMLASVALVGHGFLIRARKSRELAPVKVRRNESPDASRRRP